MTIFSFINIYFLTLNSEPRFCEVSIGFGRPSDKTTKQEFSGKYVEEDETSV